MTLPKTIWRTIATIGATATFLVVLWQYDISSDREYRLEVLEPIVLLKEPPQSYPSINAEIGQLLPHEFVKVIRMGYGKDFRAWQVVGSRNQKGWFIESGKNVHVEKN
ncbi:hypothetical protein QZJ86_14320 [Methylomonas montana]|uniref:hypothetical protein n=1 Tax=Methylomonas montana TaxID=3058963 RepID=UPI00265917E9|nr:hypothetical protein [Methylomonas montana]WKJ89193.1 hypothetical protein QZJ86_14320 [Methylomonas montana]